MSFCWRLGGEDLLPAAGLPKIGPAARPAAGLLDISGRLVSMNMTAESVRLYSCS